jgi:hypothetical protein
VRAFEIFEFVTAIYVRALEIWEREILLSAHPNIISERAIAIAELSIALPERASGVTPRLHAIIFGCNVQP